MNINQMEEEFKEKFLAQQAGMQFPKTITDPLLADEILGFFGLKINELVSWILNHNYYIRIAADMEKERLIKDGINISPFFNDGAVFGKDYHNIEIQKRVKKAGLSINPPA